MNDAKVVPIAKSDKEFKKSKSIIKKNPAVFSKLDNDGTPVTISDIYALLYSWCNDQASLHMEDCKTSSTTTTISNGNLDEEEEKLNVITPNLLKGIVHFHYDDDNPGNYVDFVVDSETLYKNLLNDNASDRTSETDPFFATVCVFFFNRNVMRMAAILAIYNAVIESIKGTLASSITSGGYYGNAVGGICVLWLYGWGYYVYHGLIQTN